MKSAFQIVSGAIIRMTRAPKDGVKVVATDDLDTVFIEYGPNNAAIMNTSNGYYRFSIRKKNGFYGIYRICRDSEDATEKVIDFLSRKGTA